MSKKTEQSAPKNNLSYPNRPFILRASNASLDFLFIVLMLVLLLFSIYIKMDSDSVYQAADPKQWVQYKPDFPEDVVSFEDLQERNPDVIGWLTIYGTNIDYPLLQNGDHENKNFYLSHNALGQFESSGSLYLDYRNNPNFTDFNTIIHGHHMEKSKMFGDLEKFTKETFFNAHEFGNLFYNGEDHGVQIIAVILADGYDGKIYHPAIKDQDAKLIYIKYIYETATFIRGVDLTNKELEERQRELLEQGVTSPITPNDKVVLLSTCDLSKTNGRYIVIAKILDHTVENPYAEPERKNPDNRLDTFTLFNKYGSLPLWVWLTIVILFTLLVFILYKLSRRRDRKAAERKRAAEKETNAYDQ